MPPPEKRSPESGHRCGPRGSPALVLIGHAGFATDRTAGGTTTYTGGSGYAGAFAASAVLDEVGLVTQVGLDFDLAALRRLPLLQEGVAVLPGASATFSIEQFAGGTQSFRSDLGVAAAPRFDLFPAAYFQATYVHLATAPPRQQLAWLKFLRDKGCHAQISVDVFEHFIASEPGASRDACERADLVFMNEREHTALYGRKSLPKAPTIVKHGPRGADFIANGTRLRVPAPAMREVDPIGAGEILAGTFLALRARRVPKFRALSYAVSAAASSVTEFGVDGPRVTQALHRIRDEARSGVFA
jgi:sugar/nucleoside kinase (ribokinase family)